MDHRALRILALRLNRISPDINNGGCCVVASIVAPLLAEYYPSQIRVLSPDPVNLTHARSNLEKNDIWNWNMHGVEFSHVVVQLKVGTNYWYFDSDGLHKTPPGDEYWAMNRGELSVDDARRLCRTQDGWNKRFDRTNIPAIRRVIKRFFTKSINAPLEQLQMREIRRMRVGA